ncbi:MAG: hypothetical protein WAY93_04540 [Atopobiaceae bacterium]|jgi:hypothetical protein
MTKGAVSSEGEPLFDLPAPGAPRYGDYVATTWGREISFVRHLCLVLLAMWVPTWIWTIVDPSVSPHDGFIANASTALMPLLGPILAFLLLAGTVVFCPPAWAWEAGGCWWPKRMMLDHNLLKEETSSFYCADAPDRPFSRARLLPGRLVVGEVGGRPVRWDGVGKVFLSRRRGMLVLAVYPAGPGGGRQDIIVDVSGLGGGGRLRAAVPPGLRAAEAVRALRPPGGDPVEEAAAAPLGPVGPPAGGEEGR